MNSINGSSDCRTDLGFEKAWMNGYIPSKIRSSEGIQLEKQGQKGMQSKD